MTNIDDAASQGRIYAEVPPLRGIIYSDSGE
jgi:hypothetical protein